MLPIALEEFLRPSQIQAIIKSWREPDDLCVCVFCRHESTERCPFRSHKPAEGHCKDFLIKADSVSDIALLIEQDMERYPPLILGKAEANMAL